MKPKAISIAVLIVAVGLIAVSIDNIPGGKVGVIDREGVPVLIEPGLHVRLPWKRATLYPLDPESLDLEASSETPGGTLVADITIEISVERDLVASLHRSYGGRYAENLISPLVNDYLRRNTDVLDSYSMEGGTAGIEQGLAGALSNSLDPYGIRVHAVSLGSLDLVINEKDAEIIELAGQLGGKVIIIGSDAFDWQIYDQVSKVVELPNIERLRREGATGDLTSMEPLLSPMIWTTMATGVEPQVHGIIDFLMKDESTGEDVPITSTMRRVPALWNILTRFGLPSGFIGWLGSYPAEPVAGFAVSDRIVFHTFDPRWQEGTAEKHGFDDVAGLTYPEDLIHEIEPFITDYKDVAYEMLRRYVDVAPEEVAAQARTFDQLDPIRNLKLIIAANTTYENIARHTYQTRAPDLLAVYLDLVDTVCHLFIKHMDPPARDVSDEDARRYGRAVVAAYAHTDSIIGEWLNLVDRETTLIMMSDHGFKSGAIRPAGPSAIGGGQAIKWHRLAGSIGLYGNHIKRGAQITDASVLDVTPTVLRLLGLPTAEDMPGRILEEAMDEGWLAGTSRIGQIESYGTRTAAGKAVRRKDEEEAILERLKALGYVGRGSLGLKRIAASHFAKGEFDKAIEIWNDVLVEEPDNVETMTAIGNAMIQKGSPEEALGVLQAAIRKDHGFLDARNLLAICYINLDRLDDASEVSRDIISEDPRNAEAYFNLGVISDKQGAYDQALTMFRRSVELRPDYDESRINLANEYLRRGEFNRARTELESAIEINPASPQARYLLGRAHQGLRNTDEALRHYRETLDRFPGFSPARISLSVLLFTEGRLEDARDELEKGLAYRQDLHLVHTNLGVLERKLEDDKAAERHFLKAIEIDGYYLAPRFHLIDLYLAAGDADQTRKQVEAILRVDPANDRARALLRTLR
jgi:tetratricopeptide (TPR) repeat protein